MTAVAESRMPFEAVVHPHFWDSTAPGAVEEAVGAYLAGLCEDAGVPAIPQVRITVHSAAARSLSVVIAGQQARVNRRLVGNEPVSTPFLQSALEQIAFDNRGLLVSRSVADAVRAAKFSEQRGVHLAGLTRASFQDYLRSLLRRCHSLDRTPDERPQWTAEDCCDHATASLGCARVELLHGPEDPSLLEKLLPATWFDEVFAASGVRFPAPKVLEARELPPHRWQLRVNALRLPAFTGLAADESAVRGAASGAGPACAEDALNGWTRARRAKTVTPAAKAETSDPAVFLNAVCGRILLRHAWTFFGLERMEFELELIQARYPQLVGCIRHQLGLPTVTRVVRTLIEEGVSVRNLKAILESLLVDRVNVGVDAGRSVVLLPPGVLPVYSNPLPWTDGHDAAGSTRIEELVETVRTDLRRALASAHTTANTLDVVALEPSVEAAVEADVVDSVRIEVLRDRLSAPLLAPADGVSPVVITGPVARRAVRELLEVEFPDVAVLSHNEIPAGCNVRTVAEVGWGEGPSNKPAGPSRNVLVPLTPAALSVAVAR